jgi:hypothetical protein
MLDGKEIPGFASILYGVWDLEVSAVKQSVEKDCTCWLYMYTLHATCSGRVLYVSKRSHLQDRNFFPVTT